MHMTFTLKHPQFNTYNPKIKWCLDFLMFQQIMKPRDSTGTLNHAKAKYGTASVSKYECTKIYSICIQGNNSVISIKCSIK